MPKPKKEHIYPSTVLQEHLRKAGIDCRTMWEIPGPPDTNISWITSYLVEGSVVLVQTFDDAGWESYTHGRSISIQGTVQDVIERTKR